MAGTPHPKPTDDTSMRTSWQRKHHLDAEEICNCCTVGCDVCDEVSDARTCWDEVDDPLTVGD